MPTRGRRRARRPARRARSRSPLRSMPPSTSSMSRRRRPLAAISAARAAGQRVFAETCPHYLALDESRYELPDDSRDHVRHLAAAPLPRRPRRAVGRARRRAARPRRHRPRARPARGREALDRPAVHRDLQRRAGHRDAAPDRLRRRRRARPDHASSGWSTCSRPRPRDSSGWPPRARSRSARMPTSCCSTRPRGARSAQSELHHTSDYTPYEGMELPGRIRRVMVRGTTSSWTAASSAAAAADGTWPLVVGLRRVRRHGASAPGRSSASVQARVSRQRQELDEVVGEHELARTARPPVSRRPTSGPPSFVSSSSRSRRRSGRPRPGRRRAWRRDAATARAASARSRPSPRPPSGC